MQKISIQKLKWLKSLHLKKYREKEGCFIIEGEKTCLESVQNFSKEIKMIVYLSEYKEIVPSELHHLSFIASKRELERISKMKSPNKILVVMKKRNQVPFDSKKKSILLENVQDPGNLGTIIRSADWFGIEQIICSPDCADVYNSKTIQSSMGSFLRVKVLYKTLIPFIEKYELKTSGAFLDGKPVNQNTIKGSNAIILGNEGQGISKELEAYCKNHIKIIGKGNAESLNVSIAASILMYEWTK